jgi:PKD repeat protein
MNGANNCFQGQRHYKHSCLFVWFVFAASVISPVTVSAQQVSEFEFTIETTINGYDADTSVTGPEILAGTPLTWSYAVTNTGTSRFPVVNVYDDVSSPIGLETITVCSINNLDPGRTHICTLGGFALEGQYANTGTAIALIDTDTYSSTDSSYYTGIGDLISLPSANPSSGNSPLTVTFTPNAITNNAIIRYEWDFEGDGTFDRSETVGRNQTFTYTNSGAYEARLRVTDNQGEQDTGIVIISVNNEPPEVSVNLNPSNGQIPLTVNFNATASDRDGIAQFEWDYDGDGIFDETTFIGVTSNTYVATGAFQARLRVTDNLGAATTLTIPTLEVNALPVGSPSVTLTTSPTQGNSPLLVNLSASATDPDGSSIDQYEWDIDGDGTYDQTTTTSNLQTTYSGIGTFYPRVRVTDSGSQQAEDVAQVFVEPQLSLSVSTDTIDPVNSETSTVSTTLGGDTEVSVVIEDRNGQLIRTLVPFTARAAGTYSDVWDGTNETSEVVSEGDYRAILFYRIDGVVERLDLALTTGGIQSNPPRACHNPDNGPIPINPDVPIYRTCIPPTFYPLADDPLDITFAINRASEVTAFVGLYGVNTRLVTFMQRQPLGRGSYGVTWNGANADGQLIESPPADGFLFGIFAYTLPDNAIYVRSGVHISSVSASPSIFQPTELTADGSPNVSRIDLELNRAGNVTLTINDTDSGATVAQFNYSDLAAGSNTITWDGRDNNGSYVAPGTYRLGVSGTDSTGYKSLTVYALQRVFY